jgi:subtilisin-like proprotein convertase family protein
MKKHYLLLIFMFSLSQVFAQRTNPWQVLDNEISITSEKVRTTPYSENQKLLQFNTELFKTFLTNIPDRASGLPGAEMLFPNVEGKLEKFLVWESSNFEPGLQEKYPDIRAFVGRGVNDPTARLNFSFSPLGIQTMVFRADLGAEYIEPYTKDKTVYVIFDAKTRIKGESTFVCSTDETAIIQQAKTSNRSSAQIYKTMRLALSCTSEYTTYFGGTVAGALAGMNNTMTRVNAIMENDLAIKLLIIANNNLVIYNNAATDPYSSVTGNQAPAAWNTQVQNALSNVLGNAAYDIGHLFGASGGGGNAGCIGCVCDDDDTTNTNDENKGSGYTSPYDGIPEGDNFDIDYVAHEMGHQLGAFHTFSYGGISLSEDSSVNVEPGSGSTIMGYAGIASPSSCNVQAHSDAYYASKSITQIQGNMVSKACPISYNAASTPAYTNTKPTVSTGGSITIPIGTAFKLVGTATGTAGEVLTYCWEDNNDATDIGATESMPSPTKTNGPNFRSKVPSASPIRYMPDLASVLAGNLTTTWETVSTVGRTMSFSLAVRDNVLNGGQTNSAPKTVTVNASAGPFLVTSQNVVGLNWAPATTQTVTWSVANTTILTGSTNVNIKLSTDGGLNFDTVLVSNTPNDGSETITVPNIMALNCRILVEPTANVFWAVNTKAFSIGATCYSYTTTPNAAIADATVANTAGATTTSILSVPDNITINNLKVNLKINHPKTGDLVVKILHPDGTIRTLWNRSCNSATYSGIDITFADSSGAITCASPATGTHNAAQSSLALAGYNGKSSTGNWTLTVTDNNPANTGTLVSWGLDFGCTLATNDFEISNLAIYPNPNRGNFNIQFDNVTSNQITVNVFDMSGRKIFENNYAGQATFNENIQLNNAETGVYLVTVMDGTRKVVKRIIVE